MIGVSADGASRESVSEFFELFKTPWEWIVPGKTYRAVLIADGRTEPWDASLAIVCGASEHPVDRQFGVTTQAAGPKLARFGEWTLPIYSGCATFRGQGSGDSLLSSPHGALDYRVNLGDTTLRRLGYNPFAEVAQLLSEGQPSGNAHIPTLEIHIAVMRRCLEEAAVAYIEIPPQPDGAAFLCCLTHDVDFFGLRRHLGDRTLAGFLWRATAGTATDLVRGRRPLDECMGNWLAAMSLPLVMSGLSEDPWHPFRDYAAADSGRKSTFFLVPFKNHAGVAPDGATVASRAVAYDVNDIKADVQDVAKTHTELAVHGLDAWRDSEAGHQEKLAVAKVSAQEPAGVRMHWLYFSADSPRHIEDAGFDYDSTCGYNDAVGFRAGTLQAFRLPNTQRLLELPLAIMDTAMFYPDRMGLSPKQAGDTCSAIVSSAQQFGGALVINWHDRSLAPERLWGRPYQRLQQEVESSGGCFVTAAEAIRWFRWRRSIAFEEGPSAEQVTVRAPAMPEGVPAGRLVVRGRSAQDSSLLSAGTHHLTL